MHISAALILICCVTSASAAGGYRIPPKEIVEVIDVQKARSINLSPDKTRIAILQPLGIETLNELAHPEMFLAGMRFDPQRYGAVRRPGFAPGEHFSAMTLKEIATDREYAVTGLPGGSRFCNMTWSPDGRHISLLVEREGPAELWVVESQTGRAKQLTSAIVSAMTTGWLFSRDLVAHWVDNKSLIVPTIANNRGPVPTPVAAVAELSIAETDGLVVKSMSFAGMLKDSRDEKLLEHYATAELVRIDLDGEIFPLGIRGIIAEAQPSPNGRYAFVRMHTRPFSRTVWLPNFPESIVVLDIGTGKIVKELTSRPLWELVLPAGTNTIRSGPRDVQWRADAPATLCWVEAVDGGNGMQKSEFRDEVLMTPAPFDKPPESLIKLSARVFPRSGIVWGDGGTALISEYWNADRQRLWRVAPDNKRIKPKVVFDYSRMQATEQLLTPVTKKGAPVQTGRESSDVLYFGEKRNTVYFHGIAASPEGTRPFVAYLDLATNRWMRVWESREPFYEEFQSFLGPDARYALVSRESPESPPGPYVYDLKIGAARALAPSVSSSVQSPRVKREVVQFSRPDGVTFVGVLSLPKDWKSSDGPLPTVLWTYPRESRSSGQGAKEKNSNRYPKQNPIAPWMFALLGYAVLEANELPITTSNGMPAADTFIDQLVSSADTIVSELVRRGVSDRNRLAIAGHSYGAYTAANFLAHSGMFRAGIALNGYYNRISQPFGHQGESRTFWQARDIYLRNSPFVHADRIKAPLLLLHGSLDDRIPPENPEEMFKAMRGLGGRARFVLFALEGHGIERAREDVLHAWWEMSQWLDRYVKNPARDP